MFTKIKDAIITACKWVAKKATAAYNYVVSIFTGSKEEEFKNYVESEEAEIKQLTGAVKDNEKATNTDAEYTVSNMDTTGTDEAEDAVVVEPTEVDATVDPQPLANGFMLVFKGKNWKAINKSIKKTLRAALRNPEKIPSEMFSDWETIHSEINSDAHISIYSVLCVLQLINDERLIISDINGVNELAVMARLLRYVQDGAVIEGDVCKELKVLYTMTLPVADNGIKDKIFASDSEDMVADFMNHKDAIAKERDALQSKFWNAVKAAK